MDWLTYAVGFVSSPVALGLTAWMGKIWAASILEKDKAKYRTEVESLLQALRTQGEKELFVHRLQFEKEFAIYQELWKSARRLVLVCHEFSDLSQSPVRSRSEMYRDLVEAHDALLDVIRTNEPFYSEAVYEVAEELRRLAVSLHLTNRRLERRLEANSEMSEKRLEEVIELDTEKRTIVRTIPDVLPRLRDAIRGRIWSTMATGWDLAGEAKGDLKGNTERKG